MTSFPPSSLPRGFAVSLTLVPLMASISPVLFLSVRGGIFVYSGYVRLISISASLRLGPPEEGVNSGLNI